MARRTTFALMRYFSIASLLSIIAASLGLSLLYRKIALDDVVRLGESGNTEITQVFANAFGERLSAFVAMAPALSADHLRAHPQTVELHALIRSAVKGTAVIKVKAYTLDGRTVYSSEAKQIGEDKRGNAGFISAKAGKPVTEITQRDHFSAFEQQLEDRGVLSTYLPMLASGDAQPQAVFELYQDITPTMDKVQATQRTVVAGIVGVLLLLYGVLFLVVDRAARILRRQEAQAQAAAEHLRQARDELELRVAERTRTLALEQERQAAVLRSTLDCIISTDVHGLVTEFNLAAERSFGYKREQAIGRPFADLTMPAENRATYTRELQRFAATGSSKALGKRIEMTAQRKCGERFPAELTFVDVRMGEVVFFTAYVRDLSERKLEDAKLLASQARNHVLATMVEQSNDSIHARDLDGTITYWNQGAERFSGFSAAEAIGQPLRSLHLRGQTEPELDKILQRIRNGKATEFEGQRLTKAGQTIDVVVRTAPLFDDNGQLSGEISVLRDVTKDKCAERALRDSESKNRENAAFLHALLDALPVGVSLVGPDKVVAISNEACLRLLQLPTDVFGAGASLEQAFLYNAVRGDYGPGDPKQQVAARMALWHEPQAQTYEHMRPNGAALEIRSVCLPDGNRLATFTDITERKRSEQAMLAAKEAAEAGSRAKSSFLAVMSHEIRTPMNAVIGLLELLSFSALDAEQRDTVKTVRDSSKSLLRLIDDVLDFSKIEAGKLDLHVEPASLAQMFEAAHHTFSGVASQKGVRLVQRMDPRIGPAHGLDRLRLRQILNNFLSNAIKFTDHGEVELSAELVDQQPQHDLLRISVRDSGVGMGAAALERLFKPFSQADAGVERRYGGTGLGLSICQRLAELMGATIAVTSTPGLGTRIALTLPAGRADAAELQAAQPAPAEALAQVLSSRHAPTLEDARRDQRLVLVVDDHPVNRRMLARQLSTLGYAAQTAADGHEALALWRQGGFGLLITDCQMPGMDGYQLAATIRAEPGPGPRLPIVACTANVSHDAFEQCRAAGMDEALAKPIELAALQRMLDHWLPEALAAGLPGADAAGDTAACAAVDDFAAVAELAQGDRALERELLEDFRQENAVDLAAAEAALHATDGAALQRAAHRIKGAAQTVGALGLSQAAQALEAAAPLADWMQLQRCLASVQQQSQGTARLLLARLGAPHALADSSAPSGASPAPVVQPDPGRGVIA